MVWIMSKVNNKNTDVVLVFLIANFEQVNAGRENQC